MRFLDFLVVGPLGDTRVGAVGDTRIGAVGDTRIGAVGDTRVGTLVILESEPLIDGRGPPTTEAVLENNRSSPPLVGQHFPGSPTKRV